MIQDPSLAVQFGDILLPNSSVDLPRWAVIACDQFTSQPEYWQKVEQTVGDAPSTLRLILPEVYLNTPEEAERVQSTQAEMRRYQQSGILRAQPGPVYVERSVNGATRHGLMLALDLEAYDFRAGSQSLIRATEGTILDRLPPRMRIREGASLELPHILVLIDDPSGTVIEPIRAQRDALTRLYDFDLMLGSGHLSGYALDESAAQNILAALRKLAEPAAFQHKYGVGAEKGVLLFAMGDGNHSLATAKSIWEKLKPQVGMDHPARYALVEVENVHDAGLAFHPIHRVLFGVHDEIIPALQASFGSRLTIEPAADAAALQSAVDQVSTDGAHRFGLVTAAGAHLISLHSPQANLPVGSLQAFLDEWKAAGGFDQIDYVHGAEVTAKLGAQPGNAGLLLPAMQKSDLFKTVILDGVLPRKTFSMGEAEEKRFYMEARKISE